MTVHKFELTKSGSPTIEISADNGSLLKNWRDLTAPSCLTFGVGIFTISTAKVDFSSAGAGVVFRFFGKPFEVNTGDSGAAVLELFDSNCDGSGWTWIKV